MAVEWRLMQPQVADVTDKADTACGGRYCEMEPNQLRIVKMFALPMWILERMGS
jgi:hypothetical protein